MNQNEFQGTSLNYCNIVEFTAARKTFLSNIIEAISKRFSEFSETAATSVISATRIANFRIWPKTWDSLKGFKIKCLFCMLFFWPKFNLNKIIYTIITSLTLSLKISF